MREGLTYTAGSSEALLNKFYHLLLLTRRRHQIPPQPIMWFRNLMECLGENLRIRVASKGDQPVASLLTITYRKTVFYKYGCSDAKLHNLGGMSYLLWKTIEEAKKEGIEVLDLGRSDSDNPGLIEFKDRLGAQRHELSYYRYPASSCKSAAPGQLRSRFQGTLTWLPDSFLRVVGGLLYRHVG
jgi:lipid II:glycine glycyltransferase (peptidoglycan interpeptide bridge formation enzyme)